MCVVQLICFILNTVWCLDCIVFHLNVMTCLSSSFKLYFKVSFKAAVLQNILKIISYKYFKISPQIYIIVVRKKIIFSLFCFKNRQFAFLPSEYFYYT